MLISRVSDDSGGEERAGEGEGAREDIAQDFQTASELFELMTKDHDFGAAEEEPLTTRDLVLLYKNIDLGKQLMSNVNELKRQAPNQYVETVIYQDDPGSESDLSEAYSTEDLHNIVLINKERIDLLTNKTSNTLCHKFGDMEIQTSNITTEYDRQFLFKDPYLQEQLKSLKLMSSSNELNSSVLPASLLDYICCKRLEDNYNFYMDNIIKYVKNTIEQLKRISNGDYLTDKAKQKWKEVEHETDGRDNSSKVLTASTSIPLHVERKLTGLSSTWDDLVHSEVDLRSLAKILEKKIVLEVPKVICGSYKLFTNRLADNLIISCQRQEVSVAEKKAESRVDVVFQLQRSETGQVVSNIDSIMILQSEEPATGKDGIETLSLTYNEAEDKPKTESPKIIELLETERNSDYNPLCSETELEEASCEDFEIIDDSSTNDYPNSENGPGAPLCVSYAESPRVAGPFRSSGQLGLRALAPPDVATSEDIQFTVQALKRQVTLPDKSHDGSFYAKKRRSPTRVRVKSPYENKSHITEEKKRKKLLEVRERRERRKMAMNENKITKHKICKSVITPQASSSVTKLSITNKSFYNSIYGQNFNSENNNPMLLGVLNKAKGRKAKNDDTIPEVVFEHLEGESERDDQENNSQKYVNRSYYLDEAVTEMYLQMKQTNEGGKISTSTSAVSNDSATNTCSLSQYMSPSFTDPAEKELSPTAPENLRLEQNPRPTRLEIPESILGTVPTNSPKDPSSLCDEPEDKVASTVECRRSIEKVYMLMKKLGKIDARETTPAKKKSIPSAMDLTSSGFGPTGSEPQAMQSDSGTSLKHHTASSNPSNFSFEKPIAEGLSTHPNINNRPVEPKVIISTKEKPDADKSKHKRVSLSPRIRTIPDNPLKAISQLLHEFDNVQKTRQKLVAESKSCNRAAATEGKNWRQEQQKRRGRVEQAREEPVVERASRAGTPKARARGGEANRGQALVERKKISELIEEAKEARGEAVRGPGRLSARLDLLAQPKRAYVQARSDDRAARPQITDRLARGGPAARPRARRGPDPASPQPVKPPPPPLERAARRRSAGGSGSPDRGRGEPRAPAPLPPMLKKKMVAVESYVKSHYGRGAVAGGAGHVSRAPLLPSDVELSSMTASTEPEESGAIGSKLHRIVHSMLARPPPAARREPSSQGSMAPNVSLPRPPSTDSIASDDIFLDKQIVTAVEAVSDKPSDEKRVDLVNAKALQPFSSVAELEMLENALYRKMSLSAFPKRLRIKNLTLTPKHSLQRIVVLQSGDTTSVVLESKLSQNIQMNASKSSEGFQALPLSTTHLDFRFAQFPVQISTVGYAFPSYERQPVFKRNSEAFNNDATAMVIENMDSEHHSGSSGGVDGTSSKEHKTCQCFKGVPLTPSIECAVQAYDTDFSFPEAPVIDPFRNMNKEYTFTVPDNSVETNTTDQTEEEEIAAKELSTHVVIPEETREISDKEIPREAFEEKTEIIDYTTSLDMLVGLLNEIQKITTCTSEVTNDQATGCGGRSKQNMTADHLKSSSSLISLYVSDTDARKDKVEVSIPEMKTVSAAAMPEYVSKEVSAQFPDIRDRQHVSVFTDVPSQYFLSGGHTGSLVGSALSGPPSSRSMFALNECQNLCSQPSIEFSKEALQVIGTKSVSVKSLVLFHNKKCDPANVEERALICKKMVKNAVLTREKSVADDALVKSVVLFKDRPQRKPIVNKCCLNASDLDPMIKMKRDILVTVYSILVLAVFAALSFPEVMQQT